MTAKSGEQVFAAGFYGCAIRRGTDCLGEVLLRSKGLVHVVAAPEDPHS
jgi:hypothetical protein